MQPGLLAEALDLVERLGEQRLRFCGVGRHVLCQNPRLMRNRRDDAEDDRRPDEDKGEEHSQYRPGAGETPSFQHPNHRIEEKSQDRGYRDGDQHRLEVGDRADEKPSGEGDHGKDHHAGECSDGGPERLLLKQGRYHGSFLEGGWQSEKAKPRLPKGEFDIAIGFRLRTVCGDVECDHRVLPQQIRRTSPGCPHRTDDGETMGEGAFKSHVPGVAERSSGLGGGLSVAQSRASSRCGERRRYDV